MSHAAKALSCLPLSERGRAARRGRGAAGACPRKETGRVGGFSSQHVARSATSMPDDILCRVTSMCS